MILQGISEKKWFYSHELAMNAVGFIERYCHHYKGKLAPKRIRLSLWERSSISLIFGIVDGSGKRQFTEVFWMIGRKMGKTLLAGAIATYMTYAAGEFGSEVYFLAPKLEQADLCYSAAEFNVHAEPELDEITKSTKYRGLVVRETNSFLRKLAFSSKKSDGFNPMFYCADEIFSWSGVQGLRQWEVMASGTGAREEPLGMAIGSGGYENDGIGDELMKRSTGFLTGNSKETHILPIIYMIDDPDKWDDLKELEKSLPGMGESVSRQFIRDQIDIAHESISKAVEFKVKYCGLKQTLSTAWLTAEVIRKSYLLGHTAEDLAVLFSEKDHAWQRKMMAEGKIGPDGNKLTLTDFNRCYGIGGIDLSQTTDLTACSLIVQRGGIIYYFVQFFLPEEMLEKASVRDGIPYEIYIKRGWLKISGTNYVDYEDCYQWFTDLITKYKIYVLGIGIDRYCAQYLQAKLEAFGFHCDTVFQGRNLTGVIERTEGMMKDGTLQSADGNELMKLHWMDSALKLSTERNMKQLVKVNAKTSHVDGVASLLDALCIRGNIWQQYGARLENAG